ncbi:amidohydrolase family protein [Nocardioides sp. Bht2]|uniref:amidohydrolase family protein n=1 Tax=Nocardioides sp. Bht2 TaxID=3392297 RepID=UPI0039B4BE04
MTKIFDMHIHILRDAHHGQEVRNYLLADQPVPRHVATTGTVTETLEMMRSTGVDRANVVMFTWTGRYYRDGLYTLPDRGDLDAAEHELRSRVVGRLIDNNRWAEATTQTHPKLGWFCGIDPVLMTEAQLLDELETRLAGTATGVALMPQDLGIRCDDRRLWPVYDHCSRQGTPVLIGLSGAGHRFGRPRQLAPVLAAFPALKVILSRLGDESRFGGRTDDEVVMLARAFPGVHVDTSMRMADVARGLVSPDAVVQHLRAVGADRVTYGSGYCFNELVRQPTNEDARGPQHRYPNTVRAVETLLSLPLTSTELSLIASENFLRLTSR